MPLTKRYIKSTDKYRVTFKIPKDHAQEYEQAYLVGDFNDWDSDALPMKRLKDKSFSQTVDLEKGRDYRFRYRMGNGDWINEPQADRYEPTEFADAENSVVEL
jgi:1,4-alpha-glucan branching enzyme